MFLSSELISTTAKVRIKDHSEKVKQKRQKTLQTQLKQKVKDKLVTMQIDELKPVVGSPSGRSRSPAGELARARSPGWKTVQHTTMALHMTPEGRAHSARSRTSSSADQNRYPELSSKSGYDVNLEENMAGISFTFD